MNTKSKLFILGVLIVIIFLLGYLSISHFLTPNNSLIQKQTIPKSQNTSQNFTFRGQPVQDGAILVFVKDRGGVFMAKLNKVYEENNNLFLDIVFQDSNKKSNTQKIFVHAKNIPNTFFSLTKATYGEIQEKDPQKPLMLSYKDTFDTLKSYVGKNVVFTIYYFPPMSSGLWKTIQINTPSSVKLNEQDITSAQQECNKAFFFNVQGKIFNDLHCIPYVERATVN